MDSHFNTEGAKARLHQSDSILSKDMKQMRTNDELLSNII
jgi:hypothetical protein